MSEPITKQRSPWVEQLTMIPEIQGVPVRWFQRRVGDGLLLACVGDEPAGWHLSISFRDNRRKYSRYPVWDEIIHAREQLLPDDVEFVMVLPRSEEYVALHDTTFHLHENPARKPR